MLSAARMVVIVGCTLLAITSPIAQQETVFTPQVYARIDSIYGTEASEDVAKWRQLVAELQSEDLDEKLYQINRFFNRFDFVDDLVHWQQKDYWATPIEFISTGAGDCEDYTIAKYFSLIELGVPEQQLRLMYVTALELRQPHMVLAYYGNPNLCSTCFG